LREDGTLFVFDVKRKDRNVSKRDKDKGRTGDASPGKSLRAVTVSYRESIDHFIR
jgi:hypothetical protein